MVAQRLWKRRNTKQLRMMNFRLTGHPPEGIMETQAWLRRAHANAKAARVLVKQDDPELLVEAVTQVQQACEKATKAILLANGMAYSEVTAMGHNTIGAFVNLMALMLVRSPLAEDFSRALVKEEATESANTLAKLVLSGPRNKKNREDVVYAFKQVLPPTSGTLGNRDLEVEEWRRLTRAFPPKVVEMFVAFHERFSDMWRQYINEMPNIYVDASPLLAKEVKPETWVFSPAYAGLPKRFPGQESESPINPILANLAQQLVDDSFERMFRHIDRKHWPATVNIRELLLYISNWLTSLGWLFLCAIVTTPHAVSSRYPAEEFQSGTVKGSQHYNKQLGVVACIGPLAVHTEEAIRNLIRHYRQIENDYRQMLR